jgi:C4-dicarboxylate-specific signal transduction histidine kinase
MAQRGQLERTELNLNDVLQEALHFLRHEIESKSVMLSVDIASTRPNILADRIQLQQVIINLLINSIQAIVQANSPERRIRIALEPDESEMLALSIHDSGPGIAPDNIARVFDSFFTTKSDGMGIGLAVCQSILVAHGGRIEASNHPDGGACFRCFLPIHADDLMLQAPGAAIACTGLLASRC